MMRRVLVLAPHTDDGEFGCGGTIARFIEEGKDIYYAAFSTADQSIPEGLPHDILARELMQATSVLGIRKERVIVYHFEVRQFSAFRQKILEEMVRLEREINPDLVLLPSLNDTHQDHNTVSLEGFRAFKKTTILGYEVPWNNLTFQTSAFIALNDRHVEKKIEALSCYESQSGRQYSSPSFIRSLSIVRGTQVGIGLAEVFDAIRWVIP